MAVLIRDEHLEKQINRVRESRGDKTMAKTLCDIAREWLTADEVHARLTDDGNPHTDHAQQRTPAASEIPADSPASAA